MKKRLRKKLAKKAKSDSEFAQRIEPGIPDDVISVLATECWRLRKTAQRLPNPDRALVESIAQRSEDALRIIQTEIEDWTGRAFDDGLTASVLVRENSTDLGHGEQRVIDTVAPAIYRSGKLIQRPQVVVAVGRS